MITFEVRRRLFWGLVWSILLFGVVGCQTTPPRTHSAGSSITPASAQRPVPIIPTPRDVKPAHNARRTRNDRVVDHDAATDAEQLPLSPSGDSDHPRSESKTDRTRTAPNFKGAPKPTQQRPAPKPTQPEESENERHPSKWREKLKAKYA